MSAAYKYFISYLYEDGGGNVDITLAEPIQSIDDIRGVERPSVINLTWAILSPSKTSYS
ncbi:hypothetical protein [Lentibacillus salicampi]|uniref:hypothetical protein n=1 Tax=Lentibacillus salicampi TaxID=175306 RepID=UPI001FD74BA0|nr:hypothetical protein [Lentibacillus salicampi]